MEMKIENFKFRSDYEFSNLMKNLQLRLRLWKD